MIRFVLSQSKKGSKTNAFLLAVLLLVPVVISAEMESSSYKIQFDSINVGGELSSSESYSLEDTAGEIATGDSSSENYEMRAGYQQMNESYISISNAANITMDNLSGITGDTADGSTSWTVTTDSYSGYEVKVAATSSPALQSENDFFADYVPSTSNPDYTFGIPSSSSEFGFSPEGGDIISRFKDNGSTCAIGSSDTTGACWDGFATSTKQIVQGASNHPTGTLTTLKVRAANGSDHIQTSGTYTATIVVTALTL